MADFVLKGGREITFDFYQMSYAQWKGLFDSKESDDESDSTVARVSGMKPDELRALPFPEYKRLLRVFFERARDPIADPNP